jgi:uncharacterized RDD family membrane protein YckC
MFIILGSDGKEYGPVTVGNVIEWIRDGRANLTTKAKRDHEDEWKTLGDFTEFSRRAPEAAPPPPVVTDEPESASTVLAADPEAASRWLRLPAALIDGLLKTLCYLPISIPLVRTIFAEALSGEQRSFSEITELTSNIVNEHLAQALPFLGSLLLIQFFLLATRGQTIGKWLLRLRIVRHDDSSAPGWYRAFLLRANLPFMIEQIPVLGFVFWIADSAFIFRADRRCLHDHLAGTKVITG